MFQQQAAVPRITIGNRNFEGPYTSTSDLKDQAGIYVILDRRTDGKWHVLDVGESETVKTRIENHERQSCWRLHATGTIACAVYYTPGWSQQQRCSLEGQLRDAFNPPCGER